MNILKYLLPYLRAFQSSYHLESILQHTDDEGNYSGPDLNNTVIWLKYLVPHIPALKAEYTELYNKTGREISQFTGKGLEDILKSLDRLEEIQDLVGINDTGCLKLTLENRVWEINEDIRNETYTF